MEIIAPNKRIGVGVSGGMDSMALLHLLLEAQKDVTVINIDHGIRAEESQKDSEFVADFCKRKNIPFLAFQLDVLSESKKRKESLELCARNLRYQIFNDLIYQKKVDVIALAHHASDNMETVFMRILRGTGIRGLKGIQDREKFIHPLIGYSREDIERYVSKNNIEYVFDSSNDDSSHTRNFIRNEIVPIIKKRFDSVEKNFSKLIDTAKEADDFIQKNLLEIRCIGNCYYFEISEFAKSHAIIQKTSILNLFEKMGVMQDIETRHLEYIISLTKKANNAELDLPFGIVALREYDKLVFLKKEMDSFSQVRFDIDGKYVFFGEKISFEQDEKIIKGRSFDSKKIPENAVVRERKEGDIFKKCGGKTKKLSDFLTDIKMPKRKRQKLLVVANGKEVHIICGLEISDKVKIDENTQKIYTVKKEPI